MTSALITYYGAEVKDERICGPAHLHVSSPPSEAQQLLVLAGDEVDGGVFQQGGEHEEQTHGHPDVDGLHVGHLDAGTRGSLAPTGE